MSLLRGRLAEYDGEDRARLEEFIFNKSRLLGVGELTSQVRGVGHSLTHSLTHALTHSLTRSLLRTHKHAQLLCHPTTHPDMLVHRRCVQLACANAYLHTSTHTLTQAPARVHSLPCATSCAHTRTHIGLWYIIMHPHTQPISHALCPRLPPLPPAADACCSGPPTQSFVRLGTMASGEGRDVYRVRHPDTDLVLCQKVGHTALVAHDRHPAAM